jgi:alkylation response protein AidB-like acyl-CoA dehydrogenase
VAALADPDRGWDAIVIGELSRLLQVSGSTTTQIYEGTNQIQRMVMARQLLK